MPPGEKVDIESMVGTTIAIRPQSLMNRGRLFTTQWWITRDKLLMALDGLPKVSEEPPRGWVSLKGNKTIYVIGDGNHRIGITALRGEEIPLSLVGVWPGDRRTFSFNVITNKIRAELSNNILGCVP